MASITAEQLDSLAPKAKAFYRDAFLNGSDVLAKYGINDTALRLAHFMAQVLHESPSVIERARGGTKAGQSKRMDARSWFFQSIQRLGRH